MNFEQQIAWHLAGNMPICKKCQRRISTPGPKGTHACSMITNGNIRIMIELFPNAIAKFRCKQRKVLILTQED